MHGAAPQSIVCSTLAQTPLDTAASEIRPVIWLEEEQGLQNPRECPHRLLLHPRTCHGPIAKCAWESAPRMSLRSDPRRNLREYLFCCSSMWVLRRANKFLSRVLPCILLLLIQSPSVQRMPVGTLFQGIWAVIPHVFAQGDFFPVMYHSKLILEVCVRVCVQVHGVAS